MKDNINQYDDKKNIQNFAVINNLMQIKNNKIFISNDQKITNSPLITKQDKDKDKINFKNIKFSHKDTKPQYKNENNHFNSNNCITNYENRPYSSIIKKNLNSLVPIYTKEKRNIENLNEENSTKETNFKASQSNLNSFETMNEKERLKSGKIKRNVSKYYFIYKLKK